MRVGVLGAGQLGRMLALAGYPLGCTFRFYDSVPGAPAGDLAECMVGEYTDFEALRRFAEGLDVITYEFENVPVEAAAFLQGSVPVFPPPKALELSQDRFVEKEFITSLQIPTPLFAHVSSADELKQAIERIGVPAILKTRRFGYDGKGQSVLQSPSDSERAWKDVGEAPSILEQRIPFEYEVSVLAVRSRSGDHAFYPLMKNRHAGGILRVSQSPVDQPRLQAMAEEYGARVLDALSYVGVLALEFFVLEGELLINEMAPRVHNSGHLTIEGSITSQFQNHLRAILGLPLGSTAPAGHAAMVNLIGEIPERQEVLQIPGSYLHLYGKEPRPNRKLGHVTVVAGDARTLELRLEALLRTLGLPLSQSSRIISQS